MSGRRRSRALTLAEAMVALFLVNLLLLGGMSSYVRSVAWTGRIDRDWQALLLARSLLDERRSWPWRNLVAGREELAPVALEGTRFTPVVEIAHGEGVRTIRVEVAWEERGSPRTVAVETLTLPHTDGRR